MDYQLIVIGAGPGGYVAALRAAENGLKVAVVENREAGGTCLNRGCVPTKTLLHSSKVYSDIVSGGRVGVTADGAKIDLKAVFAHKREVCEKLSSGIEALFKRAKVDLIRGTGKIIAAGKVKVTGGEVEREYSCESILVATGSVPSRPPIPGLDLPGVMTSDELLESGDRPFSSMVIIGGGVIGVEMATFYSDVGCAVTVIEGMDRLLPSMDRELGQNLSAVMKKRGVMVHVNSTVRRLTAAADGITVEFSEKDEQKTVVGEVVLCAIGRRPYFDGLFADGLTPETDGRRLKVNERFETSMPGVFAIGDVSSKIQLAHYASAQGSAFADMMCGANGGVDLSVVPGCVYCRPEIAAVGLTEADCKEKGIPAAVGKATMYGNAKTVIESGERAFIKVVAHAATREILGAQLMCGHATDIVSQISVAIANRMTAEQLLKAMRPHPTYEETLTDALNDLTKRLDGQTTRE